METCTHPDVAAAQRLGNEIAELSAHIEVATARLLNLIREFDALGGWTNGFTSCAEWLSWRVGLDLHAAYERVRVARALPNLPRIAEALARGELSYSKVRALTRVATAETEDRLLAFARCGTAAHVEGWFAPGAGWTALPRTRRRPSATKAARSMCIKTKTACSSSAAGSPPRSAPWSGRRSRRRVTACTRRLG